MDWTQIGAMGELLGAAAVVVSLIYLSRQVRESSLAEQRAQYLELGRELTSFANGIAREGDWARISLQGFQDKSQLTPVEVYRFYAGLYEFFRAWEALFHYSRGGRVHAWGAEALSATMVDILGYPGTQDYWADCKHWFSKAFQDHVDDILPAVQPTMLKAYGLPEGR